MPRASVALVTSSEIPDLDPDDAALIPLLAARGVDARPAVWDNPGVDWDAFDLAVIRSTRDYSRRREEFVRWAHSVPRLANTARAVEWNTDKHYLRDLEDAGVPIVHTDWLEPGRGLGSRGLHTRFPALGDFVIKPAVSAGSLDTERYSAASAQARGRAIVHSLRLLGEGRTVMLQRYVQSIDTTGESALVFIEGRFAWAARKEAMLDGQTGELAGVYRHGRTDGHEASEEEVATARQTLAAAARLLDCAGTPVSPFLYARVDVVAGPNGPEVMELELTEPSLYAGLARGGPAVVAAAIAGRVLGDQAG
ncbi:MAG: hypothetical protein LBT54_01355 [Bifidobacteriaceae bacterium]|jgi:hypothetical protein|nr:hypothetical protein [Bifidobacteriaceae bacterium]